MSKDILIKQVQVEFLRGGPPHNQLLSPLTSYLAISGNAGAGIVRVPYEHAEFERRLKDLRYETGDTSDRQAMLHSIGTEMGQMLGAVPGVPGALDSTRSETFIHLRITLSASELALLPFELSKVPVSATSTGENWLSLQSRPPVCITRNIRTVSPEGVTWPDTPRILFIVGDKDSTPYLEHRQVMLSAIEPFRYPADPQAPQIEFNENDRCQRYEKLLTILVNPTLGEIRTECNRHAYTHVHVLAHGDLNDASRNSFGLVLFDEHGAPNIVSGEQFAGALISVQGHGIHRPTVVTLASCDSANVGTIIVPGASFAHALHQSGIPLVIASQFPLSKDGSIPLTKTLYEGLLWGGNPLVLLHQARTELHTGSALWHDWASLVVYEALPLAWAEQLDTLRYKQSKRAMNAALERIDLAVKAATNKEQPKTLKSLNLVLDSALDRLPFNGQYGIECLGLRASSRKRLAQAVFQLPGNDEIKKGLPEASELLQLAFQDYLEGARGLLLNDSRGVQRIATLHWLLVQVVSLSAVLGREPDESKWLAAKLCADLYVDHHVLEERAWAHGSLAELWLVRLAGQNLTKEEKASFSKKALEQVTLLGGFYPHNDDFPIKSTRRQLERYVRWWGATAFEKSLPGVKRSSWTGAGGLIETANKMIKVLQRKALAPSKDDHSGAVESIIGDSKPSSPGELNSLQHPKDSGSSRPKSGRATKTEPTLSPKKRTGAFFEIEMLQAGHGDALWIEYGTGDEVHRVLIDCGTHQTVRELSRRMEALPEHERFFELFVMTHIDSDHIGGALPLLKTIRNGVRFGDVWFNGWRHLSGRLGARQGEIFSSAIEGLKLPWNSHFDGDAVVVGGGKLPEVTLPGGMKLTLLSPQPQQLKKLAPAWSRELKRAGLEPGTPVDYSRFLKGTPTQSTDVDELAATPFASDAGLPNGSSIGLLAEFKGASIILGADAHAPVLVDSIRKLMKERKSGKRFKVDAFKVSHHASQNNVSTELIELLKCPKYLISTNGDHFNHPDRQAVARIIKHGGPGPALYFNYKSDFNSVWEREDLQEKYNYTTTYPEPEQNGIGISLLARNR
jgi:beta-lactamase superfamily II metal-dependent hydrolase